MPCVRFFIFSSGCHEATSLRVAETLDMDQVEEMFRGLEGEMIAETKLMAEKKPTLWQAIFNKPLHHSGPQNLDQVISDLSINFKSAVYQPAAPLGPLGPLGRDRVNDELFTKVQSGYLIGGLREALLHNKYFQQIQSSIDHLAKTGWDARGDRTAWFLLILLLAISIIIGIVYALSKRGFRKVSRMSEAKKKSKQEIVSPPTSEDGLEV
jgi:hypothetical protein